MPASAESKLTANHSTFTMLGHDFFPPFHFLLIFYFINLIVYMSVLISCYTGKHSKHISLINEGECFLIHQYNVRFQFVSVTGYLTEFLMWAFPRRHCTAGRTPRWELCNRGKLPSSTSYKIVSLEATIQQPSPAGPLTGTRALTLHTGGRSGHREPLQHSHSQTS